VILQHAKVLAIDQLAQEHQESPRYAKLVTLEVTQEQALKILLAVNVGKLSLILRQASEVAVAPQARVTTNDLFTGETPPVDPRPAPPAPPPPKVSDLTRVTVTRSMRSEDYEVPKDDR
jgi:pilus assembly protein CpaB